MRRIRTSQLCLLALLTLPIAGVIVATVFGLDGQSGWELLREQQFRLTGFVVEQPLLAGGAFMAIYAVAVAASIPGLAVLTIIAGYLFGWWWGAALSMLPATLAGTVMFLIARSALGAPLRHRAGPFLRRLTAGFRQSALIYVFILNLVPIFPYTVVIAIPAACGVSLTAYVIGSFCGILPATLLFAQVGAGLGHVLARSGPIQPADFMTPQILAALGGIAVLALLPAIYRAMIRREVSGPLPGEPPLGDPPA